MFQKHVSSRLRRVHPHPIIGNNSTGVGGDFELFCCVFQDRGEGSLLGHAEHAVGEFRVGCQGDFKGDFGRRHLVAEEAGWCGRRKEGILSR